TIPILIMDMIDQGGIFLHLGQRIHSTIDDVSYIRAPACGSTVQGIQYYPIILFCPRNGGVGRVGVKATDHASFRCPAGNFIDPVHEIYPPAFYFMSTGGILYRTKYRARKFLQ